MHPRRPGCACKRSKLTNEGGIKQTYCSLTKSSASSCSEDEPLFMVEWERVGQVGSTWSDVWHRSVAPSVVTVLVRMNRVLYLSAIPLASALPIQGVPATSNSITFFAVLFTTLSTLTFLCVSKFLFRKSRRSWFTRLAALTPTSTPAGNKASILSKFLHTQPRPGLLVGFLGSPTWETCLTLNVHKTLHERRRSFFAVDHPPRPSSKYWYSSLSFRDSNTRRHRHLSSISFGRALEFSSLVYQPENGTAHFTPRPPPPALHDSSRVIPRRRYSLPSIVRNAQHAQVKRSCSTKARRLKHRRPEVDSISFSPVLPEKALSDSVAHIFPLPLSPLLDAGSSERYRKLLGPAPDTPSPSTNYGSNRTLCSPTDESSKITFPITE